ncbi:MAG: DNA transformation protein [Halocynthiibacter sp.]|jgi:DNA transformation protein
MPASPELIAHARDLFAGLGTIGTGGMFGGTALYVEEDVMFATILNDTIWMKCDETSAPQFLEAGAEFFTYQRANGMREVKSMISLPEAGMDDPDEAIIWANLALAPAREAALKKRAQKARKAAKKAK